MPETPNIEALKKQFALAKGARERFEPDMFMNLAFFLGHQWTLWGRGRISRPQLADWRRTPVDNRILPIVTSRAARKVKSRPSFVATPYTDDEADIGAARIAEKVLDVDYVELNLGEKLFEAVLWAEICGAGFWKVHWDSTKGQAAEFLFDPSTGEPFTQSDGNPVRADAFGQVPEGLDVRRIALGDVSVDVLSPFELYPDPLARRLDEAEWVIEEKVRSREYVKRRFKVDIEPDAPAPLGPVESRMAPSMYYGSSTNAEEYKGVRVYEMWERPCSNAPAGRKTAWAREQVLDVDEAPFDPMPYVMFSGIRAPNRFWPTAITTHLRGPQTELNKLLSQVYENATRIGNPALMRSRQANIEFSGLPGEIIEYDSTVPDAAPSYLQPPEIPGYVREQIERLQASMMEIAGQHEVSSATVPTGVTAASAINLLQEADDTRLGPEQHDIERGVAAAGTKIVRLRARYNTDERLIHIAGEDGNWDIFSFKGQMLGPHNRVNVDVQAGSAMPRSKAAKQAAMLEVLSLAFQYGIQLDPRDLRRFFRDYEVGALERLFGGVGADEQQVVRENRSLSRGQAVPINTFDDHEAHIAGHTEHMKSVAFERLLPGHKQLFSLHLDAHREAQVQAVNAQMQTMSTEQSQRQAQELAAQQAAAAQGGPQNGTQQGTSTPAKSGGR